jgi:hypothetical protein
MRESDKSAESEIRTENMRLRGRINWGIKFILPIIGS